MHRQKRNLLVLSFLLTALLLFPAQHVSAKVTVRKPVISSVSGDKNIVSLSWRRVSGAKGYQVFYKEKGRSYRSCFDFPASLYVLWSESKYHLLF